MMMGHRGNLLVLLFMVILVVFPLKGDAWGWFGSSRSGSSSSGETRSRDSSVGANRVLAEFSVDGLNNPKGLELMDRTELRRATNTCWQKAYGDLFAGCSQVLTSEEKRSKFAWDLSDCFQRDSGRPPFPHCDKRSSLVGCREKLSDSENAVFLQFYFETNALCHQLQADAFKRDTERLVTALKYTAEDAEDKLVSILQRSESLSRTSNDLRDSLSSIDHRTQQLSQESKNIDENVRALQNHSEAVFEQSRRIAASQSELQEGQSRMNEQLEEGMARIHDSYRRLGQDMENLRIEAAEIENEILKVRDMMFSKMETLQVKADAIENTAGASLEKQRQLLDGQSTALEGLRFLKEFQSEALQESRSTLQRLADYSSSQQQELLDRQHQLHQVHDHLVENSKSILEAQEAFESKQATMFVALDKLFALHNAMLVESRWIKAFFMYSLSILIIYMFTSTKQTYNVRPWLYIGLCVTFLIEILVLRFTMLGIEQQTQTITFFRSLFAILASAQLLHAIFTYRNYEVLNHQMLLTLMEKVNCIQGEGKLSWETDSDIDWSEWIDTDLPDEVDSTEDPDYGVPRDVTEGWIAPYVKRDYGLRQRLR